MTSLITCGVWASITKAAKAAATKAHVAVAYSGTGASRLLPLRAGSTLVVDMSTSAVKTAVLVTGMVAMGCIRPCLDIHRWRSAAGRILVPGLRYACQDKC